MRSSNLPATSRNGTMYCRFVRNTDIQLWAAFLFLAVFIAFAVMSGFTINAYRLTYTFQGSGIYSDTNTFSLNSNSVILFAFILATAFFIAAFYFFLARVFTKVSPSSIAWSHDSNSSGLPVSFIVFSASAQRSYTLYTGTILRRLLSSSLPCSTLSVSCLGDDEFHLRRRC